MNPSNGQKETKKNDLQSNEDTGSKSESSPTPTSSNFLRLLRDSKKSFRKPTSVAELVGQLNYVGTAVLNGEANIEVARAYGTIVRTAAQALNAEMSLARMTRTQPSLTIGENIFEED